MLFHSFFRLFYWILFWGYPLFFHVLKFVRLLCYSHSGFSFRFVLWNKKKKGAHKFVCSNKKSQKVYSSLSRSATFIPMSVVTDTGRILSAAAQLGCVLRRLFDWFISTYLMNNE
jgi:hypothetical protein